MWDEDDRAPKKKERYTLGAELEDHSVEALNGFVAELRAEIERIEAAIRRKGAGREAAEGFFRK